MKSHLAKLFGAAILACSFASQATLVGVFGDETTTASSVASGLGYDVEVITDFNNLAMYDVVWGLNGSNGAHLSGLTDNVAQFDAYVWNGGTFLYHDRNVADGNLYLPGADNFAFNRDFTFDDNIDLVGPNGVAGGDIDDSTLDGGTSSSHGYVSEASIDMPYMGIFTNGQAGQFVDFHYSVGMGNVYYSTIPMDYYLAGSTPAAFADVYAPNVLEYAASLSQPRDIPEPMSIALFGLALSALGFARRKA